VNTYPTGSSWNSFSCCFIRRLLLRRPRSLSSRLPCDVRSASSSLFCTRMKVRTSAMFIFCCKQLQYNRSYRKFRSALSCLSGADTMVLQSNCVRSTCSRSLHSNCLGRGSNPYSSLQANRSNQLGTMPHWYHSLLYQFMIQTLQKPPSLNEIPINQISFIKWQTRKIRGRPQLTQPQLLYLRLIYCRQTATATIDAR